MSIGENPFRLLDLPTTATTREIRRRAEELSTRLKLGLAPQTLTEDRLRSARQALEDPAQRSLHELFWLLSDPDIAPPSTNPEDPQDLEWLLPRLQQQIVVGVQPEAILANHDLAVIRLARFAAEPIRTNDLGESLSRWIDTVRSDAFWTEIDRRSLTHDEPRLEMEFRRLRDASPSLILDTVVAATTQASPSDRSLAGIVSAIRDTSGYPRSNVDTAARALTRQARDAALEAIVDLTTAVGTLKAISDRDKALPALRAAQMVWRDQTRSRVERLRHLDPVDYDPAVTDTYARQLSQLAQATAYLAEDWPLAFSFMDEALRTVQSPYVAAELVESNSTLRRDYHISAINRAVDRLDWLSVAAHTDLAIPYADKNELTDYWNGLETAKRRAGGISHDQLERRKQEIERNLSVDTRKRSVTPIPTSILPVSSPPPSDRAPSSRHRERRTGLWWSVGIVAVVGLLIFLVITNGPEQQPQTGNAATVPTVVRQTPTPRPTSTPTCRDQIQTLKNDLERQGPEIDLIQDQMSKIEADLKQRSAELDRIDAQYPGGLTYAPQATVDEYNRLVDAYNRLLAQQKQLDSQENRLVAAYNEKVDRHNSLIQRC